MDSAYQVFNPQTGLHTKYETESEAKAAFLEIAKLTLTIHTPSAVKEITHSNGDVSWVPVDFISQLIISI